MSLTSYRAAPPRAGMPCRACCAGPAVPGLAAGGIGGPRRPTGSGSGRRAGWQRAEWQRAEWQRAGRAWRRPTLPRLRGAVPSALRVFTAEFGMGSGAWPLAMATRLARPAGGPAWRWGAALRQGVESASLGAAGLAGAGVGAGRCTRAVFGIERVRAISTGQLRRLLGFHLRPIDVVVFHGSRRDLVLRGASRLDAFSGYPVRT